LEKESGSQAHSSDHHVDKIGTEIFLLRKESNGFKITQVKVVPNFFEAK
jgi:hypothetical protein